MSCVSARACFEPRPLLPRHRFTIGDNPQYRLNVVVPPRPGAKAAASVWLLLTRHVTEKEVDDEEEDHGAAAAARNAATGEAVGACVLCL